MGRVAWGRGERGSAAGEWRPDRGSRFLESSPSVLSSLTVRAARRSVALACVTSAVAACALPPDDVHLAPLYSHHRLAGGGGTHEALGGIVEVRHEEATAKRPEASEVAVRPL